MSEKQLDSTIAAGLSGTTDAGVTYPTADSDPWLVMFYIMLFHCLQVAKAPAGDNLRVYPDATTGTTVGIRPGRCLISGVRLSTAGGTVTGLTNNATSHVWAYNNSGTLAFAAGAAWPGTTHIKLADVAVSAGAIDVQTGMTDLRGETVLSV